MQFHTTRAITLALGLALSGAAQDPASSPAPILQTTSSRGLPGARPGTERWIVQFATRGFDLVAFRTAIQTRRPAAEVAAIVADLERAVRLDQAAFVAAAERLGARVTDQWWIVNAAAIEIEPAKLDAIRKLPNVSLVQPDEEHAAVIITATNANNHAADALQAAGHRGLGVSAGIVDTGQDSDISGAGRPHRTYFVNGDINNSTGGGIGGSRLVVLRQHGTQPADDVHGHGTGVASIVAGADWGTASADDGHAPLAGIAGYAIANATNGNSSTAVMATAWQAMAADRAQYSIVAANLSYSGSPSPLDASQQALDSAALNADIMVCVAAGNSGPAAGSTTSSQSAANGLAVAAITPNSRVVANFSSRGPLSGDTQRFYPDIGGCGVSTIMAARDNEAGNYTGSGTSMASPQVCGAATQLRGRFTFLTALETKAILLASTEDISSQNPGLTRNDFGMGFLRNDRAHALTGAGQFGTASVTSAAPTHTFTLPAVAGQTFAIAIAWHRLDLASTNWSNLELEILDGSGSVLVASTTPRNLYEMVRFVSPLTGNLTVRARAVSVNGGASQPFAWAWTDSPGARFPGSVTSYGTGCQGTGTTPNVCASINTNGGTIVNNLRNREYGYRVPTAGALSVSGFEVFSQSNTGGPVTVAAAIYADTGGVPATTPLAQTTVTIGATAGFYAGTFTSPIAVPAGNVWIGIDHRAQTTILSHLSAGASGVAYSRLTYATGAWTVSTLVTRPGMRILCAGGGSNTAVPQHAANGNPALGGTLGYALGQAKANTAAVLMIGASDTAWLGGALPYSLAGLGAPGCSLLASTDLSATVATDANGAANFNFSFPNQLSLLGSRLHTQYIVVDPTANGLGLAFTNAVRTIVGN